MLSALADAVAAVRADAKAKGVDQLTMREINQIVAEVRREKDPLYGQTHKITVNLSERMYRNLKAAADANMGGSITWTVRQAIGDYLERRPQASKRKRPAIDLTQPEPKITKAIFEGTDKIKTGRYEPFASKAKVR